MGVYYNEYDPFAANWLRQLIKAGHIPPGDVDERSIEDVTPDEIIHYTSHHFFAGIGGWAYALHLAGWPDDRPVVTGSPPCQPFSSAGKGKGFADERHLWPAFLWIIRHLQPATLFGEQVSSKAGWAWFDVVSADLEAHGYAVGAADLCAAGVGAPHIRQRLYFVADAPCKRIRKIPIRQGRQNKASTYIKRRGGFTAGFWADAEWLPCLDGKARAVEPGIEPLAYGLPARVGRLRGYGNAIVAPLAAEFVGAYMEAADGTG